MKTWIRNLLSICVFGVALLVTGWLLNDVRRFTEIATLRDKLLHYQEHKDEYDTLFFGTSRTYRGVMPKLFDQLNAEAGVPTKSFNFGIDGMFPPEDAYVTEHILRNPPKKLRWVFLELGLFADDFEARNPALVRTIYWHDLERTMLCTRSRLWPKGKSEKIKTWFKSRKGKATPVSDVFMHWRLFFVKTLNMGRGSDLLNDHLFQRPVKRDGIGPDKDGFYAMDPNRVMKGKILKDYLAEVEIPARLGPLPIYTEESLKSSVDRVRELGAEPIVFLAPTNGSRREHPSESLAVPIIDFRVPNEFPELFDPALRSDPAHMNAKGAEALTRRFSERFALIAKARGSSQTPTPSPSR
jgi:hypothetical protein